MTALMITMLYNIAHMNYAPLAVVMDDRYLQYTRCNRSIRKEDADERA